MVVVGLCAKLGRWPITDSLARLSSAMRWRMMARGKWRIALLAHDSLGLGLECRSVHVCEMRRCLYEHSVVCCLFEEAIFYLVTVEKTQRCVHKLLNQADVCKKYYSPAKTLMSVEV